MISSLFPISIACDPEPSAKIALDGGDEIPVSEELIPVTTQRRMWSKKCTKLLIEATPLPANDEGTQHIAVAIRSAFNHQGDAVIPHGYCHASISPLLASDDTRLGFTHEPGRVLPRVGSHEWRAYSRRGGATLGVSPNSSQDKPVCLRNLGEPPNIFQWERPRPESKHTMTGDRMNRLIQVGGVCVDPIPYDTCVFRKRSPDQEQSGLVHTSFFSFRPSSRNAFVA